MGTHPSPDPTARALARAGLYRLLALGFAYPSTEVAGEFLRVLSLHRGAEPITAHQRRFLASARPRKRGRGPVVVGYLRCLRQRFSGPVPHVRSSTLRPEACGSAQKSHPGEQLPEPQGPDLRLLLEELAAALETPGDLEAEYTRLFDRTVACSPYESDNVGGMRAFTKARDLADVQGFYKAFGLELGPEAAEMGDHIRVELEFVSTLALKEAYFRAEGAEEAQGVTVEAERSFLRDHVGRWVPAFCERLEGAAVHPFYAALAAATRALVDADLGLLAVEPQPLPATLSDDDGGLGADRFVCPRETEAGPPSPAL